MPIRRNGGVEARNNWHGPPQDPDPGMEGAQYPRQREALQDFAEDQARRRKQIFLRGWQTRLDEFLRFNDRSVLPNAGTVSRDQADKKALAEYDQFSARRREHLEAEALRELEDQARNLPKQKGPD